MTERIWTRAQYDKLSELQKKHQIPEEVIEEIHRVVDMLDRYYGSDRDVDRDDGGYLFLTTESIEAGRCFKELLDQYHVRAEDAELDDTLCIRDGTAWKSALYLVSNDYGITFIYPCRKIQNKRFFEWPVDLAGGFERNQDSFGGDCNKSF